MHCGFRSRFRAPLQDFAFGTGLFSYSVTLLLLGAIYLADRVVRWRSWIAFRGPLVVIPWSTSGLPKYTPNSFLRRTRDRSRLSVCKEDYCDLVFWTHSPTFNAMSLLIDAATGFTGAVAVAVDCGLEDIEGGELAHVCRTVRARSTFRGRPPLRS